MKARSGAIRLSHLVEIAVGCLAIAALAIGTSSWLSAYQARDGARDRLSEALDWRGELQARSSARERAGERLTERLAERRSQVRSLRLQQASGFAIARANGDRQGSVAGSEAGDRQGSRAAAVALRAIDTPGWYMVVVGSEDGLPVIDQFWSIDPAPQNAYYFESGTAYYREP